MINFSKLSLKFSKILPRNNFFRYGLPFLMLMTGGSFLLSKMTAVRYEVAEHNRMYGVTKEQLKKVGWKEANKSLEEEYQEMRKNIDLDNWENVRGPRPWESDSTQYVDIIQKRIQEAEERKRKKGTFWT